MDARAAALRRSPDNTMVPVILEGDFSIPPLSHQYHWFLPPIFGLVGGNFCIWSCFSNGSAKFCALPSLPPVNFGHSVIFVTLGSVPPVPLVPQRMDSQTGYLVIPKYHHYHALLEPSGPGP
ncbi:hypothetical protein FB451DRAFT_1187889 [Mycena latifolia]|nr:hypothetical protein FB451DRAFT_1187889 [Mycena latifolia]